MKISIITVVYNRAATIGEAIQSVQRQDYADREHVIVDGVSTDGTVDAIEELRDDRTVFVSEPDEGIYDALQKGLDLATGDVIGLMHSDDLYAHDRVLSKVAEAFGRPGIEAVYGDLDYVAKDRGDRIVRHWKAGEFTPAKLRRGWMPPHPTLYLRREVIERWGGYDRSYRIAADYDAILRYFGQGKVRAAYLNEVLVKMRTGGESNRSLAKILQKSREDYRALKSNGFGGTRTLVWKNLRKVNQLNPLLNARYQ